MQSGYGPHRLGQTLGQLAPPPLLRRDFARQCIGSKKRGTGANVLRRTANLLRRTANLLCRTANLVCSAAAFTLSAWCCRILLHMWAAAQILLLSGIPLPVPLTLAPKKDASVPFPCMHSTCGCMNASQCWRDCCCTTPSQRLAWARSRKIDPPRLLQLALVEQAARAKNKAGCCAHPGPQENRVCHKTKEHAEGRLKKRAEGEAAGVRYITWNESQQCKGRSVKWLTGAPALPVARALFTFNIPSCTLPLSPDEFAAGRVDSPDVPPPRA